MFLDAAAGQLTELFSAITPLHSGHYLLPLGVFDLAEVICSCIALPFCLRIVLVLIFGEFLDSFRELVGQTCSATAFVSALPVIWVVCFLQLIDSDSTH